MRLMGCNAIITGASQGFGLEVAKQLLNEGANIMLCARNKPLLDEALTTLQTLSLHSKIDPKNKVLAMPTDVSHPDDMQRLVSHTLTAFGHIDILVASAGVYGSKGPLEEVDWEEWSAAIDINLKGVALQCRAVLPHFKQRRYGKIIILSGGGATKPMPNLSAYAASKAGVVRLAETIAEEVKDFNIDVNTVAPGALNTRLLDEILLAGPEKVGTAFYQQSLKQKQQGGTPLSVGASLCAFLASKASDGITGRLLSAVWDPWQQLPLLIPQLTASDIYTLRRITPQDRQKNWDAQQ